MLGRNLGKVASGREDLCDRIGLGLDLGFLLRRCVCRNPDQDMPGICLLTLEELVSVFLVIGLELGIFNREQPLQFRGFNDEIADNALFGTLIFVGCTIVSSRISSSEIDTSLRIGFVAQLNDIEIGHLALPAKFISRIGITDPNASLRKAR